MEVAAAMGVQGHIVSTLESQAGHGCLLLSRVSQVNIGIPCPRGYPRFRGT